MTQGIKKVFVTPLTAVDSTDKEGVGTLRFEGDKIYKYVQIKNTTATVAGAAGDPVAYFAVTGPTDHRVVLDLTDASAQPVGAGVLMGIVVGTLTVAYYGWIQVSGLSTLLTDVQGTPVIGSGCMMNTTDKQMTKMTGVIASIATYITTSIVRLHCL